MKTIVKAIYLLLLAALALAACAPAGTPAALPTAATAPTAALEPTAPAPTTAPDATTSAAASPDQVALRFYTAYLGALNQHQPVFGRADFPALQDLSGDYLRQVIEIQAGFDGAGFDPVLQAQMVPPAPVEVKDSSITGDQASVTLQFGRGVMPEPMERTVSLALIDGAWQIVPDALPDGPRTPEETVSAFYEWYLGYIGSGAERRNPLADQAYRAAPFLAPAFVMRVDQMGEAEGGFGYDPFLCAQMVPPAMRVVAAYPNAARPVVLVEGGAPQHFLTVSLTRVNFNQWQIGEITCGSTPEGAAHAFYTWMLSGLAGSEGPMAFWTSKIAQAGPYLSQAYRAQIDQAVADPDLPADPVLRAQDLPQAFSVLPGPAENTALVNLQYGETTIHQWRVTLVSEDGMLKVDGVDPAADLPAPTAAEGTAQGQPVIDEAYGYAFLAPAGWRVTPFRVADVHTPAEYPVLRDVQFFAPDLDPQFVHLSAQVLVGDEAAVLSQLGITQAGVAAETNGLAYTRYVVDPGIALIVYRHPTRADTWLVFSDFVSQFAGRESGAATVTGALQAIQASLVFSR